MEIPYPRTYSEWATKENILKWPRFLGDSTMYSAMAELIFGDECICSYNRDGVMKYQLDHCPIHASKAYRPADHCLVLRLEEDIRSRGWAEAYVRNLEFVVRIDSDVFCDMDRWELFWIIRRAKPEQAFRAGMLTWLENR